ncbi:hypothetical protein C2G38_2176766 [Gigaspora rosea]|uniref:Uncharacterized protein n=1 Tax=Gigaspora rosea TaxID=44941 RepID=A0A397VHY3_9GLOM|nr:hypothetical protein C2G38_2176766 [Gigaspora rosea]
MTVTSSYFNDENKSDYQYAFATKQAIAIDAILCASKIWYKVFNKLIMKDTVIKDDERYFVDFSAQAVINTIPNNSIVREED